MVQGSWLEGSLPRINSQIDAQNLRRIKTDSCSKTPWGELRLDEILHVEFAVPADEGWMDRLGS